MTQNHRVGVTLGCFLRVVEKWDFEASEELKSQFNWRKDVLLSDKQ